MCIFVVGFLNFFLLWQEVKTAIAAISDGTATAHKTKLEEKEKILQATLATAEKCQKTLTQKAASKEQMRVLLVRCH